MADATPSEHLEKASELVAKVWSDEAFKQRLMAQPREVLKEYDFPLPPEGVEVRVVENTDNVRYLLLPTPPKTSDAVEEGQGDSTGYLLAPRPSISTPKLSQFQSLKRAAVGGFAERGVCALWSPARIP